MRYTLSIVSEGASRSLSRRIESMPQERASRPSSFAWCSRLSRSLGYLERVYVGSMRTSTHAYGACVQHVVLYFSVV